MSFYFIKSIYLLFLQDYYSIPFATPTTALTGREGSLTSNPYSGEPSINDSSLSAVLSLLKAFYGYWLTPEPDRHDKRHSSIVYCWWWYGMNAYSTKKIKGSGIDRNPFCGVWACTLRLILLSPTVEILSYPLIISHSTSLTLQATCRSLVEVTRPPRLQPQH